MTAALLLAQVRRLGVQLVIEGEMLLVDAPKGVLTAVLREALAAHKHELLELLRGDDPEVAWRLEAMRKQVPPSGPIPDLIAREAPIRPGTCFSCGDPLTANQHYRCRPCAVAAAIAIWGICPEVIALELARREST